MITHTRTHTAFFQIETSLYVLRKNAFCQHVTSRVRGQNSFWRPKLDTEAVQSMNTKNETTTVSHGREFSFSVTPPCPDKPLCAGAEGARFDALSPDRKDYSQDVSLRGPGMCACSTT